MRTYGNLKYQEGKWVIPSVEPHVAIRLKAIFGKIAKTQTNDFTFDDTTENALELRWFIERYPLAISETDYELLCLGKQQHLALQSHLEELLKPDYVPTVFNLKRELRHYQAQGTDLYLKNGVLLLGDDVGLGKTAQAIASFCDSRVVPALVVVQTHLPSQWKEEIGKFCDARVHIIKGTKPYSLPPADVYIMKYSCLRGWVDTFAMGIFKSVVFDEVQELRHTDTDKYRAAKTITRNVGHVLGMSATPIYNYGDEIYNILSMMKENCLGDRTSFLREWCGGGYDNAIKNPKALGTYLRESFLFLRRTRAEVGRELKPLNTIVHTVETDHKTLDSVDALARTLAMRATTGEFTDRGMASRELSMLIRHATGVSKAHSVAQYVRILLENGEPVLLAGWHRDVYDIWLKDLADFNPVMYTGTESPKEKDETKRKFMSGESNLMIISLRSGVGLDGLQGRCKIVVIGELDWSPSVHKQLTGRIDRDGQVEQVTAIYLVSDSGSDPPVIDTLGLKASQSNDIINPLGSVETQHSDESIIKRLAKQYLERKKDGNS